MPLDASRLASAIKSSVDAIDIESGEVSNEDITQAIAAAIITEITSNATVVIAGGSSAGSYPVT